jgi:parvulin-like peptidyl-prolyl isomerase
MRISLCVTSLFLSCVISQAVEKKADEVVASVGARKIMLSDFNRRFNEVKNLVNPPTKKQFLEDLVRFEIGLGEAESRGLEKDPVYQEKAKAELYKTYLEKELAETVQKISVSDKEMEDYYKRSPEIRFSTILIESKPGANPAQKQEVEKRAKEILDEVKKSKRSFEELVKLYSDDPATKSMGGDAGFQSRMMLTPGFYDAIANMKTGEIKGLVPSPFGFHIVKVTARRDFAGADKRQLRMAVFSEKKLLVLNSHFEGLKKKYPVSTNLKAIE